MLFYFGLVLASFAGALIQTIVGFGAAVVILLYLTNFMTISQAPSIAAVICLTLNFSMLLQFRKSIRVKYFLGPLVIFSAVSLTVVSMIDSFKVKSLTIVFGVFLIGIACYYMFLADKIRIKDNGIGMMILSSGLSGLFAGLFSIGGPTMSVYYMALLGTGDAYIANISLTFLATNLINSIGRYTNGLLTGDMVPSMLVGIAGAVAGQLAGRKLRGKLSTQLLARLVYAAVGLSGVLVIIQQL